MDSIGKFGLILIPASGHTGPNGWLVFWQFEKIAHDQIRT